MQAAYETPLGTVTGVDGSRLELSVHLVGDDPVAVGVRLRTDRGVQVAEFSPGDAVELCATVTDALDRGTRA